MYVLFKDFHLWYLTKYSYYENAFYISGVLHRGGRQNQRDGALSITIFLNPYGYRTSIVLTSIHKIHRPHSAFLRNRIIDELVRNNQNEDLLQHYRQHVEYCRFTFGRGGKR